MTYSERRQSKDTGIKEQSRWAREEKKKVME
jgi:hypothetical protein